MKDDERVAFHLDFTSRALLVLAGALFLLIGIPSMLSASEAAFVGVWIPVALAVFALRRYLLRILIGGGSRTPQESVNAPESIWRAFLSLRDPEPFQPDAQPRARVLPVSRYVLFMIVIPFIVAGSTQGMHGRRESLTPPQVIKFEARAGIHVDQARIDLMMRPWLDSRPTDIDAHMAYIDLLIDKRSKRSKELWGRPDDPLWGYYRGLTRSSAPAVRDVGLWSLAYCELRRDSLSRTLSLLDSISDQHLPHVQMIRGIALNGVGEYAKGDSALYDAIAAGQDAKPATEELARILLWRRDWKGLDLLRRDPRTGRLVPQEELRALDLHTGAMPAYFGRLLTSERMPMMPALLLLALYATGVWFFLIRWWDAFEKEPWSMSLIAVGLGALSPIGVFCVHDVMSQFGQFGTTGVPGADYLYYVIVVGLVEEVVKIVPVFLLGRLSARNMNELGDWMIYGCLSALGFSLTENYEYLVNYGLRVGNLRFFLSTPGHLSLTGVLALTLPAVYKRERGAWTRFLGTLMLVALIHGTYDFLLNRPGIDWIMPVALDALWALIFLRILCRVVSLSPFRTNPAAYQPSCTSWFMGAYALLCLLNYVAVARVLGADEALPTLVNSLVAGQVFLLLALLYTRLSFLRVERVLIPAPHWMPVASTAQVGGPSGE